MFRRVLVPLDGSETAEQAIPRAERLRARDGALHVVRVVAASGPTPTPYEETLRLEAESYLDLVVSRLQERGVAAQWEVRGGPEAEGILASAREHGCDLLALSTHGRSGVARLVFGSVAEKVIREAALPTLVVRAGAGPADRLQTVLLATDGSTVAEQALERIVPVVRAADARLLLLYVIEGLWAAGDSSMARVQLKEVRRVADRLRELTGRLRSEGIATRSLLVRGEPAAEVLAQARRQGADLVVMTPSSSGERAAFGTVGEKVLRESPVPVLVVRPAGERA